MLSDVVVDANVFMHADNPQEPRQDAAKAFLLSLGDSEAHLCVDEGFDLDEAKNRSHIGAEYLGCLRFGMLGFAIVADLASSSRLSLVSRTVPSVVSRRIRQHVRDVSDHVYVRVAFNSDDKVLTSHDYAAIPPEARRQLASEIGTRVVSAQEALPLLD